MVISIRCPPVRRKVATAWLPGSVGADVAGPLVLRKITAAAKTEGGDQSLFVNEPELDLTVIAAAGQPPKISAVADTLKS